MEPLLIFSFPGIVESSFAKLFSDCNAYWYQINPLGLCGPDGTTVETPAQEHCGGVSIFIIDAGTTFAPGFPERIDSFLRQNAANLCLIAGENVQLDTDFIGRFHDFLFWPCRREEFRARVTPLLRAQNPYPCQGDRELAERLYTMHLSGNSECFLRVARQIKKLSLCDATMLIRGETGTGKENAARALHYLGKRADCGFVPINCGGIPDELLESELFGYQRGAFTGAQSSKKGLVEIAEGGTLFLDEIDSLSLKSQAALLRFLQSQEYRPLGSETCRRANVRVVAATNADLESLVSERAFREDLYFRINVLSITMPPLRERGQDIELISEQLVQRFNQQYDTAPKRLSAGILQWLKKQPWPGNIRELENFLLRRFLLSEGPVIGIDAEPHPAAPPVTETGREESLPSFQTAKACAVREFERSYLCDLLRLAGGNVSKAARISGKERRALGKLIKKYEINKSAYS